MTYPDDRATGDVLAARLEVELNRMTLTSPASSFCQWRQFTLAVSAACS